MGWRKEDQPVPEEQQVDDADLAALGPDPAAVELEPKPAQPPLAALRKIRIKRTGKVMTVGGVHAKILVDAHRAEYIDE